MGRRLGKGREERKNGRMEEREEWEEKKERRSERGIKEVDDGKRKGLGKFLVYIR